MPFIYTLTLIILGLILMLLWKEERRFRKSITHGLANKYWILRERRRYVRFKEEIKIRYNILNKSPDLRNVKTSDLSERGLCLLTYEKLKEKSYLNLEMELPHFSKPVRLVGQVVWLKELHARDAQGRRLFHVGISFLEINPEAEALLLTHLSNLRPQQA